MNALSELKLPLRIAEVEIAVAVTGSIGDEEFRTTITEKITTAEPERLQAIIGTLLTVQPADADNTVSGGNERTRCLSDAGGAVKKNPDVCKGDLPVAPSSKPSKPAGKKIKTQYWINNNAEKPEKNAPHRGIGSLLKYWMDKKQMGNTDLAAKIGVNHSTVCQWKYDIFPIPDNRLKQIANVMGITVTEFLAADIEETLCQATSGDSCSALPRA